MDELLIAKIELEETNHKLCDTIAHQEQTIRRLTDEISRLKAMAQAGLDLANAIGKEYKIEEVAPAIWTMAHNLFLLATSTAGDLTDDYQRLTDEISRLKAMAQAGLELAIAVIADDGKENDPDWQVFWFALRRKADKVRGLVGDRPMTDTTCKHGRASMSCDDCRDEANEAVKALASTTDLTDSEAVRLARLLNEAVSHLDLIQCKFDTDEDGVDIIRAREWLDIYVKEHERATDAILSRHKEPDNG